jgi:hypothetical protein
MMFLREFRFFKKMMRLDFLSIEALEKTFFKFNQNFRKNFLKFHYRNIYIIYDVFERNSERNKENAITELVTTLINKNIINYSQYADFFSEENINIYNPEQDIEDKSLSKIEWTNKMIEIVNSNDLDSFNKHIVDWDLGLFELKCIKTYVV